MDFEFKKDKYKTARGTQSRILNISCSVCGEQILIYQKDGPGNLKRLYLDRIYFPEKLTGLESKKLDTIQTLSCPKCKEELGTPYIYKKENRKAFKVYQDTITKKIRRLKE